MSSIIRVTDIGRPGFLVYMPAAITSLDFDFLFHAVGPTPHRSTTSTTYTVVDSGSLTFPNKVWTFSPRDVDHLFVASYSLVSSSSSVTAFGRAIIDGVTLPEASTTSTSWVTFVRSMLGKPSSITINWRFEIRSSSSLANIAGRELRIYYCPVWTSGILYSRNIGANVLLTRAILSNGVGIRIDDEYCYRNTGTAPVILNLNLLPFYKIEFFSDSGPTWARIEYVRVE